MIFTGADAKHYTACLPAHVLQQYGEIRHESKNAEVSYGTFGYKRNNERIHAYWI